MLKASALTKSYPSAAGSIVVLAGVDVTVAQGETVALTGESGSGKSTLLHILACLDDPDSGALTLDGTDIVSMSERERAALRRDAFGIIFQSLNLIPSLTVAQNLAFHARLADLHDADWCTHLADALGLSDLGHRLPEDLSGGQQQRVAIGRALAARPRILFADEPTGNLDEATADRVMTLLLDLVAETGTACLMVTHSERLAARLDRRIHLTQGRLQ